MNNPILTTIHTPDAPRPRGHYSQAVVANGFVHVAGLLPVSPLEGKVVDGNAASQAEQVLRNLDAILLSAGTTRNHVVSLQVFLCDSSAWADVDAACAAYFGDHRPARTAVPILPLRDGALLELNAVAVSPG